MSADTYAKMSTDALIQRFADTAKRAGSGWPTGTVGPASVRKRLVPEMRAMATELRARKPIAKIRRLFEDENVDVRVWASGQFQSIDPEWGAAATSSLAEDFTVREVLALRHQLLEGPPPGPPLETMSIEQLIHGFKEACTRLYSTTRFLSEEEGGGCGMVAFNHVAGDSHAIAKELARRGKLDALVPLLDDPLITTRQRAATYCLPAATDRAIATLEAVEATKIWPEWTHAWHTLKGFRNGTYRSVAANT